MHRKIVFIHHLIILIDQFNLKCIQGGKMEFGLYCSIAICTHSIKPIYFHVLPKRNGLLGVELGRGLSRCMMLPGFFLNLFVNVPP